MKLAMLLIGISVGLYIVAFVMFPAITEIFTVDTGSWDPAATALVVVLVILAILAVAIAIFKHVMGGKGS